MSEHHPRGMSQWPAKLECACFTGKGDSANAAMGTEMHARLAGLLAVLNETGALPPPHEDDSYHGDGVYRAAEVIRDCIVAGNVHTGELHIEERVETEDGIFGTPDLWYWSRSSNTMVVFDFKTFRNPGRDYMAQLAGYALAICQQRELNGGKPVSGCSLRIVYGDSRQIDVCDYTLAEIQIVAEQAMAAFDAAERGEAQPTQCNWCDLCANAATCPAFRAIAETVTQADLANITEQWDTLLETRKAQLLVLAESVCKWAEAVREKAKADLLAGSLYIADATHGIRYGLRNVSGRKTPRTAEACKMLMGKGVSADAIRGELTMSAASVKKLLKGAGLKGKAIDAALNEVCDLGAGSVQMVRM